MCGKMSFKNWIKNSLPQKNAAKKLADVLAVLNLFVKPNVNIWISRSDLFESTNNNKSVDLEMLAKSVA